MGTPTLDPLRHSWTGWRQVTVISQHQGTAILRIRRPFSTHESSSRGFQKEVSHGRQTTPVSRAEGKSGTNAPTSNLHFTDSGAINNTCSRITLPGLNFTTARGGIGTSA